jgi:hypothetical protein
MQDEEGREERDDEAEDGEEESRPGLSGLGFRRLRGRIHHKNSMRGTGYRVQIRGGGLDE